jgi:hypothetical protein
MDWKRSSGISTIVILVVGLASFLLQLAFTFAQKWLRGLENTCFEILSIFWDN